jgi:hypothetical protein
MICNFEVFYGNALDTYRAHQLYQEDLGKVNTSKEGKNHLNKTEENKTFQ